MPSGVWVAILNISDRTAAKIEGKHVLSCDEVRDAVLCVTGLAYRWDDHPQRGRRAVVTTWIRGDEYAVVLYPAGKDEWNLGSAYPL